MRIVVDAMGGDHGPSVVVDGAVKAAREYGYEIVFVGDEPAIRKELALHHTVGLKIEIVHTTEVITMEESPAQACRQKKDASVCRAAHLVAEKKADAFVSAGNSGAALTSALMYLRRLPHVSRPALAVVMPSLTGISVILDVGANVDCKPKHLYQFALMGSVYVRDIFGKPSPRVGLLSIGEEETKGNELTLAAFKLLEKDGTNFIGNVEGRDIIKGKADVVVCDGFVGNVLLKFGEGLAEAMFTLIKEQIGGHPVRRLAALFLRGVFRNIKKRTAYDEYGGAPLLGVNGVCIICHGLSNAKAIKNAVKLAAWAVERKVNEHISREIDRHRHRWLIGVKESV